MKAADRAALLVGAIGLLLAVLGWAAQPVRFYAGLLSAITVFSAWPLGSIALLLTHALTGGRWGDVLRPALRDGVCSLPLLVLAMPLLLGDLSPLYTWARDGATTQAAAFYLNVPFFAARLGVYLVIWSTMGWLVLDGRSVARVAPAGLFVLAVTTTFAAIDTTMSLDPAFSSSIHGMIAAAQMGLLALAIAVLLTAANAAPDERADLGRLLLALVILGTYLDFMRLLIVWQSDLPREAPWYLERFRGTWGALSVVLVLGQFVLPFFLLLSPRLQRSGRLIMAVAALLVAASILRGWWTVLPSLGCMIGWIDVACMGALFGLGLGAAPWVARRARPALRVGHG